MLEDGDKCICTEDEWYNAFGDQCTLLTRGMKLTVRDTKYVAGLRFASFKEVRKDHWFYMEGFKPLHMFN